MGAAYADGRRRVTDLLRSTDDLEATGRTPVPACPGWTVADVVGHLTGICADVLAGNMDGVATEPWTDTQVAARRPTPLDDVLAEWSEIAPKVESLAGGFGEAGGQWVGDFVTHEHDVRGALGRPGARDSDAVRVGLGFMVPGYLAAVSQRSLPTLAVVVDDERWTSDETSPPAATLAAPPFEVMRSLTGRRSADQVRALPWAGDADPYLPALAWGPFTPPVGPLRE